MPKIYFTKDAAGISDFEAKSRVENFLFNLRAGYNIHISNVLIVHMLRAALLNDSLKYDVQWFFEDEEVDMDANLRSEKFWRYDVANLAEDALTQIMAPSNL